MDELQLNELIDYIDRLLSEYLKLRESSVNSAGFRTEKIDIENILSQGLFSHDDAHSLQRLALFSIGETLGRVGGVTLMTEVHTAYENAHGISKANSLSARWDSAASLWYH
jgi:hypothetical protein